MESKKKSLLKTISWPFVHFTFVAGIIFGATHLIYGEAEWEYVGLYAFMYMSLEMTFYYLHERVWAKFGRKIK
jgi:uncharacterized membrane protein